MRHPKAFYSLRSRKARSWATAILLAARALAWLIARSSAYPYGVRIGTVASGRACSEPNQKPPALLVADRSHNCPHGSLEAGCQSPPGKPRTWYGARRRQAPCCAQPIRACARYPLRARLHALCRTSPHAPKERPTASIPSRPFPSGCGQRYRFRKITQDGRFVSQYEHETSPTKSPRPFWLVGTSLIQQRA